jgi:hypothetical protein
MDNTTILNAKAITCPCGKAVGSFTEIDPYTKRVVIELREEVYTNAQTQRFIWTDHRCQHWNGPLFMSNGRPQTPDIPDNVRKELGLLSAKFRL